MYNRRNFLKQTGAVAFGTLAFPGLSKSLASYKKLTHPAGVQLYTFMSVIDQDTQGTLKKIAEIGYKEIESAFSRKGGYYGMKPKEFASILKDLGLTWVSHHVGGAPFKPRPGMQLPASMPKMNNLRDNYQQVIDEVAEGGVKYLVCSSTPIETGDEVKTSIETFNKAGEAAKKAGIIFAFHNHDREFALVDGQKPYDLFLSQTSADALKFELDLAWVTKAGVDPVELFKKHPGRFPLWHVKDIDKEGKTLLEAGKGTVNFKRIFDNARIAGMKHFFVEHDNAQQPFDSITTSMNYLEKLLG